MHFLELKWFKLFHLPGFVDVVDSLVTSVVPSVVDRTSLPVGIHSQVNKPQIRKKVCLTNVLAEVHSPVIRNAQPRESLYLGRSAYLTSKLATNHLFPA